MSLSCRYMVPGECTKNKLLMREKQRFNEQKFTFNAIDLLTPLTNKPIPGPGLKPLTSIQSSVSATNENIPAGTERFKHTPLQRWLSSPQY